MSQAVPANKQACAHAHSLVHACTPAAWRCPVCAHSGAIAFHAGRASECASEHEREGTHALLGEVVALGGGHERAEIIKAEFVLFGHALIMMNDG